jgi:hypothetical protein
LSIKAERSGLPIRLHRSLPACTFPSLTTIVTFFGSSADPRRLPAPTYSMEGARRHSDIRLSLLRTLIDNRGVDCCGDGSTSLPVGDRFRARRSGIDLSSVPVHRG